VAFYKRLRGTGKKPKVAVIACSGGRPAMLNAMMRDGTEWRGTAEMA